MNRDARAAVLAALREVYDGAWTRHVGTDGGRTLVAGGQVGFVGGVTPTIDRHHAVMGAMGERLPSTGSPKSTPTRRPARRSARRPRSACAPNSPTPPQTFSSLATPAPRPPAETERLIALATFVVRARSAVERDGYTRDIELVPEPKRRHGSSSSSTGSSPALTRIGCDRDHAFRVVTKAALDSVPALRFAVLDALHAADNLDTNVIAEAVRHPSTTTRRALEDLTAHGLVDRRRGESEKDPHRWTLTTFARDASDLSRNVVEHAEREK